MHCLTVDRYQFGYNQEVFTGEAFAKLATALCSWRLVHSVDLSSPIVTTMGFVEIKAMPFAGTSHIAIASFAKASGL